MCNCRKSAPAPTGPRTLGRAPVAPPSAAAPAPPQRQVHRGNLFRHARPQAPAAPRAPVVSTAVWGPPLWRVLHGLSLVPDVDWMALLGALDGSLPCAECAKHFHAWLIGHPFAGDPVAYILALHNDVNSRTRKRAWTREQVIGAYGTLGLDGVREAFAIVRPYLNGDCPR